MLYGVRQGDQYMIPFTVYSGLFLITNRDVEDVEVILGHLRKTLKNGDLFYNVDRLTFDFPLSLEETMRMRPNQILHSQFRAKLIYDGSIVSGIGPDIQILESISKEFI